jgi:hypothetical protein
LLAFTHIKVTTMVSIAEREMVRILSGRRGTDLLSDATIDEFIERSDATISTKTGKYDWAESDPDFVTIKRISSLIAAADIRKSFNAQDEQADAQYEEAYGLLNEVIQSSTTLMEGRTVNIRTRKYRTIPLRDNIEYGYKLEGIEPYYDRFF